MCLRSILQVLPVPTSTDPVNRTLGTLSQIKSNNPAVAQNQVTGSETCSTARLLLYNKYFLTTQKVGTVSNHVSLCGWTNVTSLLLKLHNEPRGVETTRCGIWRRAGLCLQPLFHSNIQIFLIHINPRRLIQFVWTYCFSAEIFHHSIRWLTAGFPVCLLNDQNYHQWLTM